MSGYLKHKSNLFLGVAELNRMDQFLDEDGYRAIMLKNSGSFGVVKYESDSLFANFKVVEDVAGSGNYKIETDDSFAIDDQGRFIRQRTIGDQAIANDGAWYWIQIQHAYITEEVGTVSIDTNGNLTGIGTTFTDILRGAPNFPSKIRLLDSASNLLDYEIVEVVDDTTILLAGVASAFTAESSLTFGVLGTFTPGHVASVADEFPFQYDGCRITLVAETVTDTAPSKTDGTQFFIARVKNIGGTLSIHDKRIEQYRSTGEFNLSNILKVDNPLIGPEWAKYTHTTTTRDYNQLQIGFGLRTAAWTLDAPNRAITFSTGALDAGRYKSTSQFSDDELNGWRIYFKDGSYAEVIDSEMAGSAIKCTVKEVDPSKLTSGDIITCVPAVDQVEIKAISDAGGLPIVDRQFVFDASAGFGLLELAVPEPTYSYGIYYRYHKGGETSEWTVIPSDLVNGFIQEDSWNDSGNTIAGSITLKPYTSSITAGFIELVRPSDAYTTFITTINTGDRYGYGTFELDNGDPDKTFDAGVDYMEERCTGVRGGGPMTVNHVIGLKSSAVLGNSFTLIFDVGIDNGGFILTINSNWVSSASPGTPIFTFNPEDFDYPYLTQCNLVVECVFNGSDWIAYVVDQDPSRINDIKMVSAINSGDFPSGIATLGTKHQGWALCNGANGTLDLTSKFVIGYDPGTLATPTSGPGTGVFNHAVVGNTGGANQILLSSTESGLPAHGHTDNLSVASGGSHTHTDNFSVTGNGNHVHKSRRTTAISDSGTDIKVGDVDVPDDGSGGRFDITSSFSNSYNGTHTHTLSGSITSAGSHTHTLSGSITSTTGAGADDHHENRPSYIVVGFLQRIKQ